MGGWSGGQYSLYRVMLGLALAARFAAALLDPAAWVALPLALGFAAGFYDRWAAAALAGLTRIHWMPYETALLLVHVAVPGAPYGSLAAAGREDPGNGWVLPAWSVYLARGIVGVAWVHGLFLGPFPFGPGFVLAHLLAFDPAWIPAIRGESPATVFYDGGCGLCHRAVRFLLAEDREGTAFRFAPLTSATFAREVPESQRLHLPDSIVLRTADAALLTRSAATLVMGRALGGFWRACAELIGCVPRPLLDAAYNFVAARRASVFGRTANSCPRVPAALAARFDV